MPQSWLPWGGDLGYLESWNPEPNGSLLKQIIMISFSMSFHWINTSKVPKHLAAAENFLETHCASRIGL